MIRSGDLGRLEAILHGFFTREGGVSEDVHASLNCGLGSDDAEARVIENRARAVAALGLDGAPLCTAYQVHGTEVSVVEEPWPPAKRPHADAMVTTRPGVALGVLTADCAPVLLADAQAGVVGAAHAGWRGALAGVIEAAVQAMSDLGAIRERVVAAVGPCIGPESYEVGAELADLFLADDTDSARFFIPAPRNGHFHFDLAGNVAKRLEAAGVGAVERLDHDTVREEHLFFSYRRACLKGESDYGRALSAIAIAPRAVMGVSR